MKKTALLFMTLALYTGSASAVIHWSDGYPEPNEIPLAPFNTWGQSAPVHTNFHDLIPSIPGLEAIKRQRRKTVMNGNIFFLSNRKKMKNKPSIIKNPTRNEK